jgi:dihydrofolate reductase
MGKLFVFNMISLDGYFAGPHEELDWHNVDEEFNAFAIDQLKEAKLLLFGRVTYDMMASFWPRDTAKQNDPVVAGLMNEMPKVVVSRTLTQATWNNTKLIQKNVAEEITDLKKHQDIALLGSSKLCVSLMEAGVVDEVRVMVNPIILGKGRPLFEGLGTRAKLELLATRTFRSGNVLLTYQVV